MTKSTQQRPVQVLVIGGGFGGRNAARRLAYGLPAGSQVTLIDRNSYLLYTPMLTEAAGRSVSPGDIQVPNSDLPRRVRVVQGTVRSADLRAKTIELTDGRTLEGDHLLFALGSTTNYRGIPGAEEHSLTMKTLDDALRLRDRAQRNVEQAARESDGAKRRLLLSFAVAGGGYTGVETIAALNDLVRDTARQHGVDEGEIAIRLIEPGPRLMEEMPESLAAYARGVLQESGVEVHTGVGVDRVEPTCVVLTSGHTLEAATVVWDTGIIPNPLVGTLACPRGKKGGIATDSCFRVKGMPGIWAIGDCAEIPKPDGSGHFFETTAQNATREGTAVARNILATVRGGRVEPFRYQQIGQLALVSRDRGVANVFGLRVRGVLAFLLWRGVYLAKLPGVRTRLGVLADWIRLLFGRSNVPLGRSLPAPAIPVASAPSLEQR